VAQHLDAGESLVLGGNEMPGREAGRGAVDHVAGGFGIVVPFQPVAPIVIGELELLVGNLLALLEAGKLFLPADRQPELDDDGSGIRELSLELVDFVVGARPGGLAAKALNRSTSTRPYQERSKTAAWPRRGSRFQNRQSQGWACSSGLGAAMRWTR